MRSLTTALLVSATLLAPMIVFLPAQASEWCRYEDPNIPPTGHCCDRGLVFEIAGTYVDGRRPIEFIFNNSVPPDARVHTDGGFVWLYEETNGIADLQRGGEGLLGLREDICYEMDLPRDHLVF